MKIYTQKEINVILEDYPKKKNEIIDKTNTIRRLEIEKYDIQERSDFFQHRCNDLNEQLAQIDFKWAKKMGDYMYALNNPIYVCTKCNNIMELKESKL